MKRNRILALIPLLIALSGGVSAAKERVFVLTDIENEPDDAQSMVRLLTYANQFDIEGLVATTSRHQRTKTAAWRIKEIVEAYGEVQANLLLHEPGYPTEEYLLSVIREGRPDFGMNAVGGGQDSSGSEALIAAVDRNDPRPLWVTVWGGPNVLAQALWKVRATRPADAVAKFVAKLRVYTISDQDDSGPWIRKTFPGVFYVASPGIHPGGAYHFATWSGISGDKFHARFTGADFGLVNNDWLDRNIRKNHGPLGAQHPHTEYLMEGDTPSFLGLVQNGLNTPEHPNWGGWGGRYEFYTPRMQKWFQEPETRPFWSDAVDEVLGHDGNWHTSNHATIWRWRSAYQNDFAARIDWTTKPYNQANHPPIVKLASPAVISVKRGDVVSLSAEGTSDPDGDALSYEWFYYGEVGTFTTSSARTGQILEIENFDQQQASFTVPSSRVMPPGTGTMHIILAVTDDGEPALTRYQRVVVEVENSRSHQAAADGFSISTEDTQVTVNYAGKLVARYNFRDEHARKPYFWPVIGPTGKSMTRSFPMETVDGEQHDHPHHRGVWFGHQGVAGTDTWLEVASKNYEGDKQKKFLASLGTIVHTAFTEISANEDQAVIRSNNDYLDSSGKQLMADQRSMIFRISDGKLIIDFDINLLGSYGDVELEDKKDAGLNVRIPTSMSLSDGKGHIINSVGERDNDTWSKKAAWVDYHGPVDGDHLGIAFLNHPSSFRHPTRWHVRDYGLFTANAFGPQSLEPTEESGTFTLKKGESIQLRHRIIFHEGDEKAAGIAEEYETYATSGEAE